MEYLTIDGAHAERSFSAAWPTWDAKRPRKPRLRYEQTQFAVEEETLNAQKNYNSFLFAWQYVRHSCRCRSCPLLFIFVPTPSNCIVCRNLEGPTSTLRVQRKFKRCDLAQQQRYVIAPWEPAGDSLVSVSLSGRSQHSGSKVGTAISISKLLFCAG